MSEAVLLDTHAVLWWYGDPSRLSPAAQRAIEHARQVVVSPITCWEVAMLVSGGRIELDRPLDMWVEDLTGPAGQATVADLTPRVAATAGRLVGIHGDPADRLIYATAADGRLPLVTKDRRLTEFARADARVRVIW